MADEFAAMTCRLWGASDDLTLQGKFWSVDKAFVTPKPRFGRPLLVNATGSPAGIAYAAKQSDLVFITSPGGGYVDAAIAALPRHNEEIKAKAAALGREVRTIINPMIICRSTESEARAYYDSIVAAADIEAIQGF